MTIPSAAKLPPATSSRLGPLSAVSRRAPDVRISDRVHDELEKAIREMRLVPGALLSETELSLQLGVSRTPLRAAISRLVDNDLLVVTPQVGTSVSLIDITAVEEACFIRAALEIAAFELACSPPEPSVMTLRGILAQQEEAVTNENADRFFTSDENLHEEIFRLAGHPATWNLVRKSKLHLDRLRRLILPAALSTRELVDEHSQIVNLLESGDVDQGKRLVHAHAHRVLLQAPAIREQYPHFFTA